MKIAIFGGAGFVGANLAQAALRKGHSICVFDRADRFRNLEFNGLLGSDNVSFVEIDLTHREPDVPSDTDFAVNLAALPHVEYSMYAPATAIRNNIDCQVNVLEAVRRSGIPLIFASSVEVYGANEGALLDEDSPYRPLSPYAASKMACEQLLNSYVLAFGIRATIARLTNLYGPWQLPDRLAPRVIARLLSGHDCEIDEMRLRDFLHVDDAARAILAIAASDAWGKVFNIASGTPISTWHVAELIAKECRGSGRLEIAKQRSFDGRGYALVSSGARLSALTGWTSEIGIEDGVRNTCNWYRDHSAWWAQFEACFRADRKGPEYIVDWRT